MSYYGGCFENFTFIHFAVSARQSLLKTGGGALEVTIFCNYLFVKIFFFFFSFFFFCFIFRIKDRVSRT